MKRDVSFHEKSTRERGGKGAIGIDDALQKHCNCQQSADDIQQRHCNTATMSMPTTHYKRHQVTPVA